ncbi:MAG: citrate lyase subunit alpha [Christensenellaceae bacterium]|nr:citrate lyase subunit alpha [Christensenellaceae bacterium]
MNKILPNIRESIVKSGLKDGMTISFHHHLRNGDYVLNMVMREIASLGIKNLTIQASALFDCHFELIEHIKSGVVSHIETNYMSGRIANAISHGILKDPVVFRSHGGRPAAIKSRRVHIDVAFLAAPASDKMGNSNGSLGKSACGSLGYAIPDSEYADKIIIITDTLFPYPLFPASIKESNVDFVVKVDAIGNPEGIVSGTTRITRDPISLKIAEYAANLIKYSGLLKDGFSFQTGAGGASLAVTKYLKSIMKELDVKGSFGLGGITGYLVDMLNEGYFEALQDVQCFDLLAVSSIMDNPRHVEISATEYASPLSKSRATSSLDVVVLGATQMDTDFNVNVHTDSSGIITGGSGGHSDTAEDSKLSIIVAPLFRARLPLIVDKVQCISTPGKHIDALVTQRGIAINPIRQDLIDTIKDAKLPIIPIEELKNLTEKYTGVPDRITLSKKCIAEVENRHGKIIDCIFAVE